MENATDLAKGASPINGQVPPPEHRFESGADWKGNPGGRPRLKRSPTQALAELNDTTGESPEAVVVAFKAARGAELCAADHKAIAMFRAESDADRRTHVSAFDSATDRLEGKITQPVMTTGSVRFEFGAIAKLPGEADE